MPLSVLAQYICMLVARIYGLISLCIVRIHDINSSTVACKMRIKTRIETNSCVNDNANIRFFTSESMRNAVPNKHIYKRMMFIHLI